jgi:hypothetical protein
MDYCPLASTVDEGDLLFEKEDPLYDAMHVSLIVFKILLLFLYFRY